MQARFGGRDFDLRNDDQLPGGGPHEGQQPRNVRFIELLVGESGTQVGTQIEYDRRSSIFQENNVRQRGVALIEMVGQIFG